MRVLNPGPGEIVDRLTIVARKLLTGGGDGRGGKETERRVFEEEQRDLVEALYKTQFNNIHDFTLQLTMLAAVNAEIWENENKLRGLRDNAVVPTVIAGIAMRSQEMNDRRAELVKKINEAAGVKR